VSLYAHFAHNKQMKTDKATAGDDRSNQSARGDMDNKLQVAFVAPTANSPSDSSSAHEAMIKSPSGPAKPGGLTVTHAGNPRRPLITARDMRGRTNEDSDFLKFLKYSNFVSLEVALRECERQQPPLYHEIIYILARMGNIKEGLAMLLRELGDVNLAVEYVERYDVSLWSDVVDYGLTHHDFLADLMDLIGLYNKFDPMTLIEK
ncbi:VPS41, partial [Symbiodinium microadriaticum]